MTPSAPYEKSKSLGSGGSMVARLKLKEIDEREPPGVRGTSRPRIYIYTIIMIFISYMLQIQDCFIIV